MRFWDASALVPLVVEEALSEKVRAWIAEDDEIALWALTRLELASAIERRFREGRLDGAQRSAALRRATGFADAAHEVTDLLAVRTKAMALLARYAIRAADAAQLGAALVFAEPDPASLTLVVLDRRLAEAAAREGLGVVTHL
ncbi:MAG TPA: type II toxin-antitoxin system VapC family toxin [Polyangia bacterium]|nr:type II toxin-antitoxin system VapC family toxin [Polyangia bacterium]